MNCLVILALAFISFGSCDLLRHKDVSSLVHLRQRRSVDGTSTTTDSVGTTTDSTTPSAETDWDCTSLNLTQAEIDKLALRGIETNDQLQGVAELKQFHCSKYCLRKCHEERGAMSLGAFEQPNGFGNIAIPRIFDVQKFSDFCDIDEVYSSCVESCGYEYWSSSQAVCGSKRQEFISHFDCFSTILPTIYQRCELSQCERPNIGVIEGLNITEMDLECKRYSCDLDCQEKVIHEQCQQPEEAALFLRLQVADWVERDREDVAEAVQAYLFPDLKGQPLLSALRGCDVPLFPESCAKHCRFGRSQ